MKYISRLYYSLLLLTSAVVLWGLFNQQLIIDWWRLRDYTPTAEIEALASEAQLNDLGRRLFYAHDPDLLNKQDFQGRCDFGEETIVLGCYLSNTKIYVLDVEDERLEGVEEVTAAHEMLHAAYDRLSEADRSRIDSITQEYFQLSNDERLLNTIAAYAERDPGVVPNELHSILATEIRDLPTDLDEYYSQYFVDRLALVQLAENYAAEFTALEQQIASFDVEIERQRIEIETREEELNRLELVFESEQARLETLRPNPDAYNAAVPGFKALVRDYNARLAVLRQSVGEFNALVNQRNQVALEERDLQKAIDANSIDTAE